MFHGRAAGNTRRKPNHRQRLRRQREPGRRPKERAPSQSRDRSTVLERTTPLQAAPRTVRPSPAPRRPRPQPAAAGHPRHRRGLPRGGTRCAAPFPRCVHHRRRPRRLPVASRAGDRRQHLARARAHEGPGGCLGRCRPLATASALRFWTAPVLAFLASLPPGRAVAARRSEGALRPDLRNPPMIRDILAGARLVRPVHLHVSPEDSDRLTPLWRSGQTSTNPNGER